MGTKALSQRRSRPVIQMKAAPGFDVTLSGMNPAVSGHSSCVIQRFVLFDSKTRRIIEITVPRPTKGLRSKTRRSTNYHTAAIIVAQDMLATNLPGLTYEEALEFIEQVTNDIVNFPGFRYATEEKTRLIILDMIDEIHAKVAFDAAEADPMNWAAYLEQLCEMYVQTIDQLDYTYHEKGSGEAGSGGENVATTLRAASLGKEIDEATLLDSAKRLIDLRKWHPKTEADAVHPVTQFMQKMLAACPALAVNQ